MLISVKDTNGKTLMVNADNIVTIEPAEEEGHSIIFMVGGRKIPCSQSYDKIGTRFNQRSRASG